ncbi:hypothetical protein CJF60_03520 [Mycoplasmopsis agassizii]|uniref:DUF2304 domain-containing protein n=2 Tax=Mycoplasmopsis agassizii TaxID=33922 RepID=A0ABX4H4G2_9BACT|nr:hypothetical protein CJF60_03520 [Mycoplasmopsis agassizii]
MFGFNKKAYNWLMKEQKKLLTLAWVKFILGLISNVALAASIIIIFLPVVVPSGTFLDTFFTNLIIYLILTLISVMFFMAYIGVTIALYLMLSYREISLFDEKALVIISIFIIQAILSLVSLVRIYKAIKDNQLGERDYLAEAKEFIKSKTEAV